MVYCNTGLGNSPNQQDEALQNPDINIISEESDSENEETFGEDGLGYYTPIPDDGSANLVSDSDEESHGENRQDNTNNSPSSNFPSIEPIGATLVRDIWNKPLPKESDIELTDLKIDEVKLAMKNFVLPSTAIPEWAKNIPEEQWKDHLLKKLKD